MAWIMRDYRCACGNEWEDLVQRGEEDVTCPKCSTVVHYTVTACGIASYSIMDKDTQAKHLRKRSRDHTRAMLKKDPTSLKTSRHMKLGK